MSANNVRYGWRRNGAVLEPDPVEQATVRLAREWRQQGLSLDAIAARLLQLGYLPRSGKAWHRQQIKRMAVC